MGDCNQLEYQLLLGRDLGYLPEEQHTRLTTDVIEVKRMIAGLIQNLHC
jgi:four helix bundle protein